MSDFKSKMPDLKEAASMASKLFKDVKTSVCEIIDDYKKKREAEAAAEKPVDKTEVKTDKKEKVEVVTEVPPKKAKVSTAEKAAKKPNADNDTL